MSPTTAAIILWLFVLNLGIAFGAGLYEHRIVVPRWISGTDPATARWDAEAARTDNTGVRFWVFVTTIPLTLLTLANAYVAWHAAPGVRFWWLLAVGAALVDRGLTFGYFIPAMMRLLDAENSRAAVEAAIAWSKTNYLRHWATGVAWLAALKTFARFYQGG